MTKYTPVSGIYVILNTKNGKVYIGQAQDIAERWTRHKCSLNGGYHANKHLQRAWNKYGSKAFKFKKLEYCAIELLNEREQHYLDIYTIKGVCYNIAIDVKAPMRGRKHSEEVLRKMSERVVSTETRRKMSESLKGNQRNLGNIPSEETRRKISEAAKGRVFSEEHKRNLSESHKGQRTALGRVLSEETRNKISESLKGKTRPPFSDETRRKMSEACKNRPPVSEETRRKISEAAKARRARERIERELLKNK